MPSRRTLNRLLDQRNEHPEALARIDAQIQSDFEATRAIFVLDMCGFSRLTMKHGIVHYLALIRRMQRVVLPCIEAEGGTLLKTEADNVFATFAEVPPALRAAQAIMTELALRNRGLPEDWDVHVGVGLGFGPLLLVGDHDAYGNEMNLASKLGEDLAQAGDILLTEAAYQRAGRKKSSLAKHSARVSGLRLDYYSTRKRAPSKR